MASEKVTAMIEEIKGLTVLELNDLVHALEEEFGVSAPTAAGGAAPAEEAKTDFNVVLAAIGDQKIKVIKVVREITGLGLAEAKKLVETENAVIKEGVPQAEADDMKAKLEEVGAKIELK